MEKEQNWFDDYRGFIAVGLTLICGIGIGLLINV